MYYYVVFESITIVIVTYNIIFMLQLFGEYIINIVTCIAIRFLHIFVVSLRSNIMNTKARGWCFSEHW